MGLVKYLFRGAAFVGGLAALFLTALALFQNKLLYVPVLPEVSREYETDPAKYGIEYRDLYFEAEDGVRLHAWILFPADAAERPKIPAILFFQENAGNISHRLHFIQILMRQLKCIVLMLSYRGYGTSEGSPNQVGIEKDSQAALQQILQQPKVDTKNIFLYGKSLGAAVALHLLVKNEDKIKGAIIENSFSSVYDMVPQLLPFLYPFFGDNKPLNFLVTNPWNNAQAISNISHTPILMYSSRQDEIVPSWQMDKLRKACKQQVLADFVEFNYSGHMDTYVREQPKYWITLKNYYDNLVQDGAQVTEQ